MNYDYNGRRQVTGNHSYYSKHNLTGSGLEDFETGALPFVANSLYFVPSIVTTRLNL